MGKSIDPTNQKGIKGTDGRPRVELNEKVLKNACAIFCTKDEAAHLCGMSVDTLDRRLDEMGTNWTEYFEKHSCTGKTSLRRAQYNAANAGNVSMLIWLGKQHLGQKDKTEHGFDPDQPAKFVLKMGKDLKNDEDLDDE